jgi:excisionase family DNA binding protein
MQESRLLYRVKEAAEVLGVSPARAYELIAAGIIPSIRLGKTLRIPVEGLRDRVAQMAAEQTGAREGGAR